MSSSTASRGGGGGIFKLCTHKLSPLTLWESSLFAGHLFQTDQAGLHAVVISMLLHNEKAEVLSFCAYKQGGGERGGGKVKVESLLKSRERRRRAPISVHGIREEATTSPFSALHVLWH